MGFRLMFADGPAQNERIYTSVEPSERRWYCRMGNTAEWWTMEEPPEDAQVATTLYEQDRQVPDPDDKDDTLVIYVRAEPDG